ncbi:hypothetical protein Psed_5818 [Pseudonocardia dioxanivorans CB1190]|uniref:Uncharacterized protein n=1 Tax=Pseudonocardia dioxanivorans (strain ATCC 55486 / DSM 44775 / JCM 13855 / CB1190) TaxID=675635 RepID=F4D1F5_PSEUX|nr:hypothetical protein [Pseudonocardia dioxanivorans]AEA27943.1 hypothetical protein Psed_5818 [Pseudonocardia dioxanivorans CB1190]
MSKPYDQRTADYEVHLTTGGLTLAGAVALAENLACEHGGTAEVWRRRAARWRDRRRIETFRGPSR